MTTTIGKMALAAAVAAASLGAQATLVKFDDLFEGPGASTESVALGSYGELTFSGAWGFTDEIAAREIPVANGTRPAARSGGVGFAFNLRPPGNSGASVMSFKLDKPNTYFTSLFFDFATAGLTQIELHSGDTRGRTLQLTVGDANMDWGKPNAAFPIDEAEKIDRIDFIGGVRFALDNLDYQVASTGPGPGPGPTVPEPTSYALVAAALAAAGLASRRRRA